MYSIYSHVYFLLNCFALILAIYLFSFNFIYKRRKTFDTLTFQSGVLVVATAIELVVSIFSLLGFGHSLINTVTLVLCNMLLCFSNIPYVHVIREYAPFVKHFNKRVSYILLGTLYIVTLQVCWLIVSKLELVPADLEGVRWFDYFLQISVGIFIIFLLFYCIGMYIAAKRHKTPETIFVVKATIAMILAGIISWAVERFFIPIDACSESIYFVIGYSFFFMFVNMDLMQQSIDIETANNTDLEMAKKIQMDELPKQMPAFPTHKDIELAAFMQTAKDVGGDLYNYFELDRDHIGIVVGDVSDKGIPAALYMMTVQNSIETMAENSFDTAEIADKVNKIVAKNNDACMFCTLWIGILDIRTHKLQYTNAGHNPPILLHADGSQQLLDEKHGMPVGMFELGVYNSATIDLQSGDRLYLYTDGVTEANDTNENMYGENQLQAILEETRNLSCKDAVEKIIQSLKHFIKYAPQFDDITMMMVDFNFETEAEETDFSFDFLDAI